MSEITETPRRFLTTCPSVGIDGTDWSNKIFDFNFFIRKTYFAQRNTQFYTVNAYSVVTKYPSLVSHVVQVLEVEQNDELEHVGNECWVPRKQKLAFKIAERELLVLSDERLGMLHFFVAEVIRSLTTVYDDELKQGLHKLLHVIQGKECKIPKTDVPTICNALLKIVGQYQTVACCAAVKLARQSAQLMDTCHIFLVRLPRLFGEAAHTSAVLEISLSKRRQSPVTLTHPFQVPDIDGRLLTYPVAVRKWPCVAKPAMQNQSIIFAAYKDLKLAKRTVIIKPLVLSSATTIRACARQMKNSVHIKDLATALTDALRCKKTFLKVEKVHEVFENMKDMQANYLHLVVRSAVMYDASCPGEHTLFTVLNLLIPMFQFCSFCEHDIVVYANCNH